MFDKNDTKTQALDPNIVDTLWWRNTVYHCHFEFFLCFFRSSTVSSLSNSLQMQVDKDVRETPYNNHKPSLTLFSSTVQTYRKILKRIRTSLMSKYQAGEKWNEEFLLVTWRNKYHKIKCNVYMYQVFGNGHTYADNISCRNSTLRYLWWSLLQWQSWESCTAPQWIRSQKIWCGQCLVDVPYSASKCEIKLVHKLWERQIHSTPSRNLNWTRRWHIVPWPWSYTPWIKRTLNTVGFNNNHKSSGTETAIAALCRVSKIAYETNKKRTESLRLWCNFRCCV